MTAGAEPARSPPYPSRPAVAWDRCPIETSLGSLGRRWTLAILRDIAFIPKASFATMQKRNQGLGPRTLSLRLGQLVREGLVRKVVPPEDRRHPFYELTARGLEVWPILAALFQYGIKNHSEQVFADRRPRNLEDVYPHDVDLMLGHLAEVARGTTAAGPSGGPPAAARAAGAPRGGRP